MFCNKESHAIYLLAEFSSFTQGDVSISDYYYKIKSLTDAMGDINQAVSNTTLVLTTLRGLNGKFSHMVTLLPMQKPFMSFIEAWPHLLLEEIKIV